MTDEQAQTIIRELQIIRKLVYTYGLGEDIPGGPSPGILAGIKTEIHELRELLEERMSMSETDRAFFDLSVLLKQQIDAFLELQNLVVATHKTLAKLHPQFEETYAGILKSLKDGTENQRDQMKMWRVQAQKTLDALAKK